MFNIHPSAIENFDLKAKALISLIQKSSKENQKSQSFDSDVHVSATITEKEIIGDVKESICDYRGNIVGRVFISDSERYGLEGTNHQELVKLAESIQRVSVFRDKLSQKFIEEKLFSWLETEFKSSGYRNEFTDFLINEAVNIVKPITIRVPIAHACVEQPFQFCNATIKNFSKEIIDSMASISESFTEQQKRSAEHFFLDFRKKYQGYAIAEFEIECEPDYAIDFGLNATKRITDLLGIYSGALIIPDIKCLSKVKGTETLEQYSIVVGVGDENMNISSGILDKASAQVWKISKDDLQGFESCGLSLISEIAIKANPTEFETTVLNMAFLYSKAAFTSDPLEKLVHMLSALESTLLRSENEPIQQNIAERLAVFTSNELSERKLIIKNLKIVYGFRSKYIHHGHSSSELGELTIFFRNVWVFYVNLVKNSNRFRKKIEFLNAIDDHKLG